MYENEVNIKSKNTKYNLTLSCWRFQSDHDFITSAHSI